jgi:hypothetical protein
MLLIDTNGRHSTCSRDTMSIIHYNSSIFLCRSFCHFYWNDCAVNRHTTISKYLAGKVYFTTWWYKPV